MEDPKKHDPNVANFVEIQSNCSVPIRPNWNWPPANGQ